MSFYSPGPIVCTKQKLEERGKVDHRIELTLDRRGLLLAAKVLILFYCQGRTKQSTPPKLGVFISFF